MMTANKMVAQPVKNVPNPVESKLMCILNKWIFTKKPDNGDAVYSEDYRYVEHDACHKHRYETKHGGDWFKVQVILVVELP
jgi:hypothetical protein